MHIEYQAEGKGNRVKAPTAKEAVRLFLERYKNRSFEVCEYRDGMFHMVIGLGQPASRDDSYFYKSFKSRDEARAWLAQPEGESHAHA